MIEKTQPLWDIARRCRYEAMAAVAFSGVANILQLTMPLYTLQIYDRVVSSRSMETLALLTLVTLGGLLLLVVVMWFRSALLTLTAQKIELLLGERVLGAMVGNALSPDGAKSSQAMRDVATVKGFCSDNELSSLLDAPWMPFYLLVIFAFDFWLGVIATAGGLILVGLAMLNEIVMRGLIRRNATAQAINLMNVEASVRNAEVVEAMGLLPQLRRRWRTGQAVSMKAALESSRRALTMGAATRFARQAVQVAIMGVAALQVIEQSITAGGMIVASLLVARALAPIETAVSTWNSVVNLRSATERLNKLLDGVAPEDENPMPLPRPTGRLTVSNLSYSYPGGGAKILKGLNFSVEPGTALAILGPSSSGKSTLARLLVGVCKPDEGEVRLDGADVWNWHSNDLGQYLGYLPQDVELFDGTVKENIARLGEADPQAVLEAAQMAGVHDLVLKLPQGYDTKIGLGGCVLSGGARQRVALARALFGRPSLLVLDEPNANLDGAGEQALTRAILQAKRRGCSVIVITHRPQILGVMDQILVVREGTVEAVGPRDEMLRRLGLPVAPQQQPAQQVAERGLVQ